VLQAQFFVYRPGLTHLQVFKLLPGEKNLVIKDRYISRNSGSLITDVFTTKKQ